MSKEYIWSTHLTADKKECQFEVSDTDKNNLSIAHTLLLRMVVLGPEAKKGELNVVHFSTIGFGEDKLEGVLCCLQASDRSYDQTLIDLTFTSDVTFKLVQGTGPVTLTGQQIFEYEGDSDDEDMGEIDERMDAELLANIKRKITKDDQSKHVKVSKKRAVSEKEESSEEDKVEKPLKKKGKLTKSKSGKSK